MAVERRLEEMQIRDFSGGYVDSVDAEHIPENASPNCYNVICRIPTILKPRPFTRNILHVGGVDAIHNMHAFYSTSVPYMYNGSSLFPWTEWYDPDEALIRGFDPEGEYVEEIDKTLYRNAAIGVEEANTEAYVYLDIDTLEGIGELEIEWGFLSLWPNQSDREDAWHLDLTRARACRLVVLVDGEEKKSLHFGETSIDWAMFDVEQSILTERGPDESPALFKVDSLSVEDIEVPEGSELLLCLIVDSENWHEDLISMGIIIPRLTGYSPDIKRRLVISHGSSSHSTVSYIEDSVTPESSIKEITSKSHPKIKPYEFVTVPGSLIGFDKETTPWMWRGGGDVIPLKNAPVRVDNPVFHHARIFAIASDDPTRIVWSDMYNYDSWPQVNYMYIGDYNDYIIKLLPFKQGLLIFKNHSTYVLTGSVKENFVLEEVNPSIGCVGRNAITNHGEHLYLLSPKGLMRFDGVNFEDIGAPVLSHLWEALRHENLGSSIVTEWNGVIIFSFYKLADWWDKWSQYQFSLAYDTLTGAFWPWSLVLEAAVHFEEESSSTPTVKKYSYFGTSGTITTLDNKGDTFEYPLSVRWSSKIFSLGMPELYKKVKRVHVETDKECEIEKHLKFSIETDGKLLSKQEELKLQRQDPQVSQYLVYNRFWWRKLQYHVEFDLSEIYPPFGEVGEEIYPEIKSIHSIVKFKPRGKVIRGE